jgi:hypothetical protein
VPWPSRNATRLQQQQQPACAAAASGVDSGEQLVRVRLQMEAGGPPLSFSYRADAPPIFEGGTAADHAKPRPAVGASLPPHAVARALQGRHAPQPNRSLVEANRQLAEQWRDEAQLDAILSPSRHEQGVHEARLAGMAATGKLSAMRHGYRPAELPAAVLAPRRPSRDS